MDKGKVAVVAIGGNSLILDKKHEDVASQWVAMRETCTHIAGMIERGWNVIVTHGNGPQVGFILRRNELASGVVHTTPLDLIGADTQGSIGYMVCQELGNELRRRNIPRPIAAVVSQVVVDKSDPAFSNPTKGIGGFTSKEEAEVFAKAGWVVKEDAGRGWRRLIGSPIPLEIVEIDAIQKLIAGGFIVVGVGGGGIPVVRDEQGGLRGALAVIDKDRASALLASLVKADLFLISTGVEKVAINYNKPDQQWLDNMTLAQAKKLQADGHFLAGSMGPKIEAIIAFLEGNPDGAALVTKPESIGQALDGHTGTWITSG